MTTLLRRTQQALLDYAKELPRDNPLHLKHAGVRYDAIVACAGNMCACGHWRTDHIVPVYRRKSRHDYDGSCYKCACQRFVEDKGEEA